MYRILQRLSHLIIEDTDQSALKSTGSTFLGNSIFFFRGGLMQI